MSSYGCCIHSNQKQEPQFFLEYLLGDYLDTYLENYRIFQLISVSIIYEKVALKVNYKMHGRSHKPYIQPKFLSMRKLNVNN